MLVIRLRRTGKKGQTSYRIIVVDSRKAVYSPYIEMLGQFDPHTKKVVLNKEKAIDWMNKGAQPSNTVSKIFVKEELKHNSISVKKYRAISKKELERIKTEEEAEKAKEQAEKEAAKEAFDAQVEQEKKENETVDPLLAAADEAIADIKEEEVAEEKATKELKAEKQDETKEEASEASNSSDSSGDRKETA